MPELPEVETTVQTVRPAMLGRRIDRVDLHRADIVHPAGTDLPRLLPGRIVAGISRRGKKIVVQLDNADRFYIHLGMSGRLSVASPDAPARPHTHLVLAFGRQEVRFSDPRRFGGVFWLGADRLPDENLGPEPLGIRPTDLARRLARTTRAIKNALLDQRLIAGLGNIYVDEALFDAAIHPLTPANTLSPAHVARLTRSIKRVLRRALQHKGSTLRDFHDANGRPGRFQKLHRVYHRTGQSCLTCGHTIKRLTLGGRSTHFCPNCQPKTPARARHRAT